MRLLSQYLQFSTKKEHNILWFALTWIKRKWYDVFIFREHAGRWSFRGVNDNDTICEKRLEGFQNAADY